MHTPPRLCNGQGVCGTATTTDCGRYACRPSGCPISCEAQSDCVSNSYCGNHSCVAKRAQGQGCTGPEQCTSGACVDGVCCESACPGACKACVSAKTGAADGLCRPIANGTDPDDECATGVKTSCGQDGMCDGSGACRFYDSSNICAPATCTGNVYRSLSKCTGASGGCPAGTPKACGNYACNAATGCKTSCTGSTDCFAPAFCSGGKCVKTVIIDCTVVAALTAEVTKNCGPASCNYNPAALPALTVGGMSQSMGRLYFYSFLTFDCPSPPPADQLTNASLNVLVMNNEQAGKSITVEHVVFTALGGAAVMDARLDAPATWTPALGSADQTAGVATWVKTDLQAARSRVQNPARPHQWPGELQDHRRLAAAPAAVRGALSAGVT